MILKNRLYLYPISSRISKFFRFYSVYLLDWSICSCVADFQRKVAPEVDANQSHRSLRTLLRRDEVHQPWIGWLYGVSCRGWCPGCGPVAWLLVAARLRPVSRRVMADTVATQLLSELAIAPQNCDCGPPPGRKCWSLCVHTGDLGYDVRLSVAAPRQKLSYQARFFHPSGGYES